MNNIKIGDKVERTKGDARNRGIVIEIEGTRARVRWTHRQRYINEEAVPNRKWRTVWTGEFVEMTHRAPRTWTALSSLKVTEGAA